MRPAYVLLLLLLGLSCQTRPEPEPIPVEYTVPSEVEPFVQAFREAALQRNHPVLVNNLIISFGTPKALNVCGECTIQAGKTPRIVLNQDGFCWQNASKNEREALVFHELGHCVLNRDHRSDRFPKGMYASLMNPDDVGVYATCRYPIGTDDCDKRPRQTYYHDELFNPATPIPAWGQ